MTLGSPLLRQRADPWILRHSDGRYYFTASVPEYDRIELRRASTVDGLAKPADLEVVWRKHESGPMSFHIWAPELHYIDGQWYIYFAAGRAEDIWAIRIYVLSNAHADPFQGEWVEQGQLITHVDSFSLDATTFQHRGRRYLIWAQKDGPLSSLFLSEMQTPTCLKGPTIRISQPELPWECIGHHVNEGPAVLIRNGRIFVTFSASATDHNYCVGLLTADENTDLLNPASWHKTPHPVFATDESLFRFGPGHNSFTTSEDGTQDLFVYHARNYRDVRPDPLNDPNRDTYVKPVRWRADGTPDLNG